MTPTDVISWLNEDPDTRCEIFNITWAKPEALAEFFMQAGWSANDTMILFNEVIGQVLKNWNH